MKRLIFWLQLYKSDIVSPQCSHDLFFELEFSMIEVFIERIPIT